MRSIRYVAVTTLILWAQPIFAKDRPVPLQKRGADMVVLKSGPRLYGAVISREKNGTVTMAVRRAWLKTASPELFQAETKTESDRILSDARNLNDVGLLSLWPVIRRSLTEGDGVESLIDTWKRQKEYRFWDARLNESFHFDAVREIAENRLGQFDRFVADLAHLHHGLDLAI